MKHRWCVHCPCLDHWDEPVDEYTTESLIHGRPTVTFPAAEHYHCTLALLTSHPAEATRLSSRVSNTHGYPGSLLEFFFYWNPGILLEFGQVFGKFNGALAFVAIDMMQLCLLWLDDTVVGEWWGLSSYASCFLNFHSVAWSFFVVVQLSPTASIVLKYVLKISTVNSWKSTGILLSRFVSHAELAWVTYQDSKPVNSYPSKY